MAQLSSNSQRTAGIEGGGTQSALLHLIRDTSAYATMLARALRELKWKHQKRTLKGLHRLKRSAESQQVQPPAVSKVSIRQENDPPLTRIKGAEQQRLAAGPDEESLGPLPDKTVGISHKDNLAIEIQVGDYRAQGSYTSLKSSFNDMPIEKQRAIATALSGDIPEQTVSIKVKDEFDNQTEFFADTQQNTGWKISNNPSENLSTKDIEEDLQRQKSPGVQKIKSTMQRLKPEGGPDLFRGKSLTVLTDGDEVIVVDRNTGIIRDAERLDQIGNSGEQAVRKSALEAAASFGIKGSAAKGIAPPRTQKQRELTP